MQSHRVSIHRHLDYLGNAILLDLGEDSFVFLQIDPISFVIYQALLYRYYSLHSQVENFHSRMAIQVVLHDQDIFFHMIVQVQATICSL